ncbi:hypothetical protein [Acetonema longum]|uniref:Uncharacterized protein n=1 Tax=Acetonema longum DSM 6540 TaxID=1009370 RepID=F7NKU6_9FIRM|nr:hypothetical protein [Acetonema longum]EGO63289.1 hypothetical protein ALO_13574 [Acetonema longum DSM 6540]
MYKLIIGNIRISVLNDQLERQQAIHAANEAINTAKRNGKLLSHIEIDADETGCVDVKITEKANLRSSRKTIRQSMLDGIQAAVHEKLYPAANSFANSEIWFDDETGQQWHGSEVENAREQLMAHFADWVKTI